MNQTQETKAALNPSALIQLSTAYWDSQTLLTANRIGLFEQLSAGGKSLQDVCAALDIQPRQTELFLKSCVALGLVVEEEGAYSNTSLSQAFLVPGGPTYLGDALRYSDNLYATWGNLEQALKDGKPPMATEQYTGEDEERTRNFVYGMHNRALGIGHILSELVDLSGRNRMIDVGGGPGTYSALFAKRNHELNSLVLDLPGVVKIAKEIIASLGMSERVKTQAMDYMVDDFPGGNDVVLISGVFHRETPETCRGFIRRAYAALQPGGLLIINDVFADEGRTSPLFATLFGLNMMLTAPDGGVHADSDVAAWIKEEGFREVGRIPFPPPMPHRIVTGVKR